MQQFPIKDIEDLQSISSAMKWQYFEKLVAFIFEQNGFDVRQNVVVKGFGTKRQFDVIAKHYDVTWLVECKKWKGKQRSLAGATRKHLERCELYEGLYGTANPLIVSLIDDDIISVDNVFVVPIMKLNWFINNLDSIELE